MIGLRPENPWFSLFLTGFWEKISPPKKRLMIGLRPENLWFSLFLTGFSEKISPPKKV